METEKKLYDLLIMVYRSPELMIKMTGSKLEHVKEVSSELKTPNTGALKDAKNSEQK